MKLDNYHYLEYSDYWPHLYFVLTTLWPICSSAFSCVSRRTCVPTQNIEPNPLFEQQGKTAPTLLTMTRFKCQDIVIIPCNHLPVVWIKPIDDFTQKHHPIKRFAVGPHRTMKSEFLKLINLMSLSTHEKSPLQFHIRFIFFIKAHFAIHLFIFYEW